MAGLGLSITDLATRRSGESITPIAITNMVIEGDSQTSTTPDQAGSRDAFYSYAYADDPANSGVTFHVRAQASRTVGGAAYNGDGADDTGAPSGNTLLLQRSTDIAYGPQLMTAMLGSNDLGTYQVNTMVSRWVDYAPTVRNAGIKLAVIAPPPYHPSQVNYSTVNPRWLAYIPILRNPATRATFADYYIPLGEHPDFRDPALVDTMFNASDKLHLTPGAATATSGQYRASQIYKAAVDTVRDLTRVSSTSMYNAAWPASETSLEPGATITRRVVVKGIAHGGLTSGASVSGPAGTTISLNGGTAGSSVGTGSGNGYAIYNGDVLDIAIPLSASYSTAVSIDLRIGGETRTLSFTTAANVPATNLVSGGILDVAPISTTHTFVGVDFANTGLAVIATSSDALPGSVTVGGAAATLQVSKDSGASVVSIWTVPIGSTGSKNVVVGYGSSKRKTTIWWGVVENGDATPTQTLSPAQDPNTIPTWTISGVAVPAKGIALAFLSEFGDGSAPAGSITTGTQVASGYGALENGDKYGVLVGKRTTDGSVVAAYNTYRNQPFVALVLKAAGT